MAYITGQSAQSNKFTFIAIVTNLPWKRKERIFNSAHQIYIVNLNFVAFLVLELFTTVLSKCVDFSLEPRFQSESSDIE